MALSNGSVVVVVVVVAIDAAPVAVAVSLAVLSPATMVVVITVPTSVFAPAPVFPPVMLKAAAPTPSRVAPALDQTIGLLVDGCWVVGRAEHALAHKHPLTHLDWSVDIDDAMRPITVVLYRIAGADRADDAAAIAGLCGRGGGGGNANQGGSGAAKSQKSLHSDLLCRTGRCSG